jgi:hypothetical protein
MPPDSSGRLLALFGLCVASGVSAQTLPADAFVTAVRLESDNPGVELWRAGEQPERICLTPCGRPVEVHPGDEFFLAGAGIKRSVAFTLARREAIDLDVKAGSEAASQGGAAALIAGAAGLVIGGVFLIEGDPCAAQYFCQSENPRGWFYQQQTPHQKELQQTGRIIVGVGLAVDILGLILVFANRTTWSTHRATPAPPEPETNPALVLDSRGAIGLAGHF